MYSKEEQSLVYCNNCDKYGHHFHNCRKPFESSGIIAFRKNKAKDSWEYLMICRKHTFGYIDFLRGKFSVNNKHQIMDIIFEMTESEKEGVLTKPFSELWLELWGSSTNSYYANEKTFANEKFQMLKRGIKIKDEVYTTETLFEESKTNWKTPEWGFPKGRKNHKEEGKMCALREWCEETGFKKENIDLVENITPFDEFVIGSNYQSYKDKYYIGRFIEKESNTTDTIKFQKVEISDAKWATYEEACNLIRPYHLERLEIIKNIDTLLNKYTQYIYE